MTIPRTISLEILGRVAFEIDISQVVEDQRVLEIEQGFFPRIQFPLDFHPVIVELVHISVKLVLAFGR